jgi:mannose-6-phosphate isomerase
MWYVLAATPDAHIYSGFKAGVTPELFQQARQKKAIPELLQSFPARQGMVFSTPGGRVHAIGAGCLLLEIQQDANTTYRLYDWDRGAEASRIPRPLHVPQALEVIDWSLTESPIAAPGKPEARDSGYQSRLLLDTPHFHVEEWMMDNKSEVKHDGNSFYILFPLYSAVRIRVQGQPAMILPRATTCLIPAALTSFSIQPATEGETVRMLAIRQP